MKRVRLLIVAVVMCVPTVAVATPAQACMGEICEAINVVCSKTITKGQACVN